MIVHDRAVLVRFSFTFTPAHVRQISAVLSPSCSLAELLRLRLKASSLGRGEKAVTEGDYSLLLYKKAGRTTREGSGRYTGPSTTEPCNSVEKVVKL